MQQAIHAALPALTFQNTTFAVTDRNGQPWLRGYQIGSALGYSDGSAAISKLYDRNADEFTPAMTAVVKLPSAGGDQDVRLFNLRGAYLLGMLARTKVAKQFRVWALDVLEGLDASPGDLQATVETAVLLQQQLTETARQRDALLALVRQQFLQQNPEYREVLRYHAIQGLNYKEKAMLMGWKTADTWLNALKKLAALGLIDWQPSERHVKSGRAAIAKTQALLAGKPSTKRKTTPPSPGQQRHLTKMRAAKAGAAAARHGIKAARTGGKADQPAQGNDTAADSDADKLH